MSALEQLVAQLEQLAFEEHIEDSEWLLAALAERQTLLAEIQKTDASDLPPALRASIKERLQALLTRDAQVIEQLDGRRDEARKALEQLIPGRAALRGYGDIVAAHPQVVTRIG